MLESDKALVDSISALSSRFEAWKHFEERADRLGDQLWAIGVWILALVSALLSLPILAGFVVTSQDTFPVAVRAPVPLAAIAVLGTAVCVYAFIALLDIRHHIESNWRRSGYARTGDWAAATLAGRRLHAWRVLIAVGVAASGVFLSLLGLALHVIF